jgi:putative transposase
MQASEEELRTKRHVVHHLHLHLVFVTKYRRKVFTEKMYQRLQFHFERVCSDFGCKLVECNGEMDHVHLLVEPLPHTTPSRLVNSLKGVSSRMLRRSFQNWRITIGKEGYGHRAILLPPVGVLL